QVGLLFLFPLLLVSKLNKRTSAQTLDDFNFRKIDFKTILISIVIGIIVFILTVVISSFFSFLLGMFGYSSSSGGDSSVSTWQSFILSIIIIAVLPAFCEEFTHRGMLLSGLKELGAKKAIIYSALFFGLLHLNIEQFFYATIIGIVLGGVSLLSRSIIPAMIIHFINNFINVYLDFASSNALPGGDLLSRISLFLTEGNPFLNIIFIVLFISLLIILLLYLITILLKINAQKSFKEYAEAMAIKELRNEILGDAIEPKEPIRKSFFNKLRTSSFVQVPYEVLGFYITPQVKMGKLDKVFIYSTFLLSGLITLFTFIWGVL
ncbi:MAG: CPBP family intramembrane metalloprotease, partial [Clostridia bacterium]|nr:CPBP family intramembrane metalloprotease [Clostridia bacterium]